MPQPVPFDPLAVQKLVDQFLAELDEYLAKVARFEAYLQQKGKH